MPQPPRGYYARIEKIVQAVPLRFVSWFVVALAAVFSLLGFAIAQSGTQGTGGNALFWLAVGMLALAGIEVVLCAVLARRAATNRGNPAAHRLLCTLVFLCPFHFFALQLTMYVQDAWPAFFPITSGVLFLLYLLGSLVLTRRIRGQLQKGHYQAGGYGFFGKAPRGRALTFSSTVVAVLVILALPSTIVTRRAARFLGNPFIGIFTLCLAPLLYFGFSMLASHLFVACEGSKRFADWPPLRG